jgi:hypothetical protein
MESEFQKIQDLRLLMERTRELNLDIAVAGEREFSKRFELGPSRSKFYKYLRAQVSKIPFLYRVLLRIKGFFN